jgi:hypothetical protein
MAVGVMVLFIAFVDEFVQVLRGKTAIAAVSEAEPAHIE